MPDYPLKRRFEAMIPAELVYGFIDELSERVEECLDAAGPAGSGVAGTDERG